MPHKNTQKSTSAGSTGEVRGRKPTVGGQDGEILINLETSGKSPKSGGGIFLFVSFCQSDYQNGSESPRREGGRPTPRVARGVRELEGVSRSAVSAALLPVGIYSIPPTFEEFPPVRIGSLTGTYWVTAEK